MSLEGSNEELAAVSSQIEEELERLIEEHNRKMEAEIEKMEKEKKELQEEFDEELKKLSEEYEKKIENEKKFIEKSCEVQKQIYVAQFNELTSNNEIESIRRCINIIDESLIAFNDKLNNNIKELKRLPEASINNERYQYLLDIYKKQNIIQKNIVKTMYLYYNNHIRKMISDHSIIDETYSHFFTLPE